MEKSIPLRRVLKLFDVTVAGVGIILGAGIYALIGVAAGKAGNATWMSFLVGAVVALFTGLSYAELSSFFKGDAGEYDYCRGAFGKKFSRFVAVLVIFSGIVSASTVALGFAGYASVLLNIPFLLCSLGLIVVMSILNFSGIRSSNFFNIVATFTEFVGLVIIIILGFTQWGKADLMEMPQGIQGVLQAGALVFFAYMGFETIVKLREETLEPDKTIPRALIFAIIITSVMYVLVSIAAVNLLPAAQLANSASPLADAAAIHLGQGAFILISVIALFSTSNTVLLTLLTSSRMVYGMARERSLPSFFGRVNRFTRTPHYSVFAVMVVAILLALIGNIETVANMANVVLFVTFALVNVAAIVLRYTMKDDRPFRMPFSIGRFPVTALIGAVLSLIFLVYSYLNLTG